MKKFIFTLITLTVFAFTTQAQINTPAASPTATLSQQIGMTDVEIVYSRPSMKDRTIFAADGLVPYGDLWRTGANSATKITFGGDVKVDGKELKKGSYAVLTKPMADKWEVMFFPYEKGSWSSYKEATPTATVTVKTMKTGRMIETFDIDINHSRDDGAHIEMAWADTYVAIPVTVDTDAMVMKDIENAMAGTSEREYYQAGSYYHTAGKDLEKAYEWVHKANEMSSNDPKFWQLRREALILADMGRTAEAIKTATRSKELAMKAGNKDYVRMNEASIAEWSKKSGMKGSTGMKGGMEKSKKAARTEKM